MPEIVMNSVRTKKSTSKKKPTSETRKSNSSSGTESNSSGNDDRRLTKATKKLKDLREGASTLEAEAEGLNLDAQGGPEAVFKREYVKMLKFNARLIKRMNSQLETQLSSRDIYALSTLMSQQREVIADLRTIVDMSEQVDMVQRQVLTPFVSDITQLITDIYFQLRKSIAETSMPKQTQFALSHLDELLKQFGTGVQSAHLSSKEKLFQILLGENDPAPKKRKHR